MLSCPNMVRNIENRFLVIALVASLLVLVKSSSSSPIDNDILEEMKAELKSLRVKVDLVTIKTLKQEEEIAELKEKVHAKLEEGQHPPESFVVEHDKNKTNSIIKQRANLSGYCSNRALVPTSCVDLSFTRHSLDGLYLVQNQDTKKIETVLCTFGTSVSQKYIGQVDVKTKTVHFYVQRNSTFSTAQSVIPFELARINEGGAFDLESGIFTSPVKGIYHFQFSAVKSSSVDYLSIFLQVNGINVSLAMNQQSATGSYDVVSLSASLRLAAGDRVNLFNSGSTGLQDSTDHFTHFAGWLVEEELV